MMKPDQNLFDVRTGTGLVRLRVIDAATIQVQRGPSEAGFDAGFLATIARDHHEHLSTMEETMTDWILTTADVNVTINKQAGSVAFTSKAGKPLAMEPPGGASWSPRDTTMGMRCTPSRRPSPARTTRPSTA